MSLLADPRHLVAGAPGSASLRRELAAQPERWTRLIGSQWGRWRDAVELMRAGDPDVLEIAGADGSCAVSYAQQLAPRVLGIPPLVTDDTRPAWRPRTARIGIARDAGSPVSAPRSLVVATAGASSASVSIEPQAGAAAHAASAFGFTARALAVRTLLHAMGGVPLDDLDAELHALAGMADAVLSRTRTPIAAASRRFADTRHVLVLGRGLSAVAALRSARQFTGLAGVAASGRSAGDVVAHAADLDAGTLVIALTSAAEGRESVAEIADTAVQGGASVVEIGCGVVDRASVSIWLDVDADADLIPVLELLPLQAFAIALAELRGAVSG